MPLHKLIKVISEILTPKMIKIKIQWYKLFQLKHKENYFFKEK